jgi:hypothetical protein
MQGSSHHNVTLLEKAEHAFRQLLYTARGLHFITCIHDHEFRNQIFLLHFPDLAITRTTNFCDMKGKKKFKSNNTPPKSRSTTSNSVPCLIGNYSPKSHSQKKSQHSQEMSNPFWCRLISTTRLSCRRDMCRFRDLNSTQRCDSSSSYIISLGTISK